MPDNSQLSAAQERFLRYWSGNMAVAFQQSQGAPWLGFGYDDAEKARMRQLTAALPRSCWARSCKRKRWGLRWQSWR